MSERAEAHGARARRRVWAPRLAFLVLPPCLWAACGGEDPAATPPGGAAPTGAAGADEAARGWVPHANELAPPTGHLEMLRGLKADAGTIRADYAASIEENVVHGSDGPDTAAQEIEYFFGDDGVCPRTR